MTAKTAISLLTITASVLGTAATAAPALAKESRACKAIKTPAQLQAMSNDLTASYCLKNDLDMSKFGNFTPVGDFGSAFTGTFTGKGHVIKNLTINTDFADTVGLFGVVDGGSISDVGLVNVDVTSASQSGPIGTGAVVGFITGQGLDRSANKDAATSIIARVFVTGRVKCTFESFCGGIGGIVGSMDPGVTLSESWSSANVTVAGSGSVGGAIGGGGSSVIRSYATGTVSCPNGSCNSGGLIGDWSGDVSLSFAVGPVFVGAGGGAGGLIGHGTNVTVSKSYAEGTVAANSTATAVGALIGFLQDASTLDQCYGVGAVSGGGDMHAEHGGLVGTSSSSGPPPAITNCYWDKTTTGQTDSAGGTPLTTAQFRSGLPSGFDASWGINKTLSYPYLTDPLINYASPLATLVQHNGVFVFLPISQLDESQYKGATKNIADQEASLATVYTMIARAIGIIDNVKQLKDVPIDKYFWDDSDKSATFAGPVTKHAKLGKLTALNGPITASNVVGAMNNQQLVILRGTVTTSAADPRSETHRQHPGQWMLGTLYTKKGNGNTIDKIVANDPFTGLQVRIDPAKGTVVSPPDFPLKDFKVNGYQTVTID